MNLHSVLSSLSVSEIENMIYQSGTFRRVVAEYLKKNKTKPKKKKQPEGGKVGEKPDQEYIEELKNDLRIAFPDYKTNRIPVINFFRSFAFSLEIQNALKRMGFADPKGHISLWDAKHFVGSL